VAEDTVVIPVQTAYLPVVGLQMLIKTISVVKKRLNKKLAIEGILLTMVDYRTNYAKDITAMIKKSYGTNVGVMESYIPFSVKVAEATAEGMSIYRYKPKCKATESFQKLTKEENDDDIDSHDCMDTEDAGQDTAHSGDHSSDSAVLDRDNSCRNLCLVHGPDRGSLHHDWDPECRVRVGTSIGNVAPACHRNRIPLCPYGAGMDR